MNETSNCPDTSIITGCLCGDRKSQQLFYDYYSPKMFEVCLRLSASSADAEDVLQEGFIKVFMNLNTYRSEGSLNGWITRIFFNTACEQRRKNKMQQVSLEPFENAIECCKGSPLFNLYMKDLEELISNQSKGYRTVFQLYTLGGYSHREIGEMMGISESTSKSQYHRAKACLRESLKKEANTAAKKN